MSSHMEGLKAVSKALLWIPMEEGDMFPLFVVHPYYTSPVTMVDGELANIYEDEEALRKYNKQMEKIIDSSKTPLQLMLLLQSQYAMTWLKFAKDDLSHDDFSELLGIAWVNCENANMDVNVPISESVEWFRKANKRKLMDEDEYAVYEAIPPVITLYRGVAKGRKEKGMSWTNNKSKAEWFKNRFGGEGYMLEMTVKKEDVLAYFSRRDEDEYLVYPKNYKRL